MIALQYTARLRRAAVCVLTGALAALAWLPSVDHAASSFIDAGLARSLASFAAARAINAALSFLQGTSVAATPLGVGVTLSLGQVLHPLTQISEHLSNVLLLASVSYGIQKILLAVGAWWPISLLLGVSAALWITSYWRDMSMPAVRTVLVMLLFVRFAVPGIAAANEFAFDRFMSARYQVAQAELGEVPAQLNTADEAQRSGAVERIKRTATAPVREMKEAYARVTASVEVALHRVVELAAIFLLQTIMIPLLSLWALMFLFRSLVLGNSLPSSAKPPGKALP